MKKLNSLFYSHPHETPARRRKHVGTIGYGRGLGSHWPPCREPVLAPAQGGGLLLSFPRISPLPSSSMAQLARVLLVPSHPLTNPHPVALWCRPVPSVLIQGNGPCLTCLRLLPTCHPKQPWEETSTYPFHWAESFGLTRVYLCLFIPILASIIAMLWWKLLPCSDGRAVITEGVDHKKMELPQNITLN